MTLKRIAFVIVIIFILQACSRVPGKSDLSVLYWNIQNGMWDGQDDNYDRFVDWVSSRNPDVCIWAEAQTIYRTGTNVKADTSERYLVRNWKELASRYGHRYVYVGGHRDNYPQVITSKYPVVNVLRITDEVPDSTVSHGAGWARIKVKGKIFNIVTVHTWPQKFSFEYNKAGRNEKAASAARNEGDLYRLKEMTYICSRTVLSDPEAADNLWIMLGDFNSISPADNGRYRLPADSTCFLLHDYIIKETPYIDAVREHSLPEFAWTTYQHLRYDYMYMTPALDAMIERIGVIYDDYTVPVEDREITGFCHPSDHLPIEAVFCL